MSDTFYIKRGDLLPAIREILLDGNDEPIDLTTAVGVDFHLREVDGSLITSASAVVENAVEGLVRFNWRTGDTDQAGEFYREWEVTFPAAQPLTVPNDRIGYPVSIGDDMEAAPSARPDLWITVDEVERYVGHTFVGAEVTAASALVEQVTSELELHLGRRIRVESHTETLPVYPDRRFLELSHTPVVSVTSVMVDGEAWPAGTWISERSGLHLLSSAAIAVSSNADTPLATVVYEAGLGDEADLSCRRVVLGAVGRIVLKRRGDELGLESISVEGYSSTWMSEGFTEEELRRVDRWRRRIVSAKPAFLDPDVYEPRYGW